VKVALMSVLGSLNMHMRSSYSSGALGLWNTRSTNTRFFPRQRR
jgi:hypothetical protein